MLNFLQPLATSLFRPTQEGFSITLPRGQHGMFTINGSSRAWVDDVTALIGTESVDINVEGRLAVTGSMIANITEDGTDGGNLNITAGSIVANDITNHETNRQTNIDISAGTSSNSSTTVGVANNGQETEGITRATIGQGNITVKDGEITNEDPLRGLNRDIDKVQEITRYVITNALDANSSTLLAGTKTLANNLDNYNKGIGDGAFNIVYISGGVSVDPRATGKDYNWLNFITPARDKVMESLKAGSGEPVEWIIERESYERRGKDRGLPSTTFTYIDELMFLTANIYETELHVRYVNSREDFIQVLNTDPQGTPVKSIGQEMSKKYPHTVVNSWFGRLDFAPVASGGSPKPGNLGAKKQEPSYRVTDLNGKRITP